MESDKKIEVEITSASEADVPALIQSQFLKMNDLKMNLEAARKKAEAARMRIEDSKTQKVGLLKYKNNIEDIQETQMYLSEATLENTEAQEKSFQYQQALAEITKYLFGLGVTSITMNRTVVRELELKLSHASEAELDDLEKEEIANLIRELKSQEDIMKKQSDLLIKVKNHEERIAVLERENSVLKETVAADRKRIEALKEDAAGLQGGMDAIIQENAQKSKRMKIILGALGGIILVLLVLVIIALAN